MRNTNSKILLSGLCLLLVLCMGNMLQAATFTVNTPELGNLTIVEADPYLSGGTAGNTLRVEGTGYWDSTSSSSSDGLWRQRTISGFHTGYDSLAGATIVCMRLWLVIVKMPRNW